VGKKGRGEWIEDGKMGKEGKCGAREEWGGFTEKKKTDCHELPKEREGRHLFTKSSKASLLVSGIAKKS